MEALPDWEHGSVAILSTTGETPHAIPVSTAVRAGPRLVLLALALRRRSLAHLRAQPRVALTIVTAGDVAITAHCRATVRAEPMRASDRVAAIALEVDSIQDHGRTTFVIDGGVRWRWVDPEAEQADAAIRAELLELARR
jgi:flavin reductase (DIM6/NTAB) family NADH-FMN oxidoreductase RutF